MHFSVFASAGLLSFASLVQASPQLGATSVASAQTTATQVSSGTTVPIFSQVAAATGTTACNNSPDLCNRNYNNITHMGAHDSAFLTDSTTSFTSSGNQYYNVTVALNAGIRLLQAQVHNSSGVLELCHTSCSLLDGGSLLTFLTQIKLWMDSNLNEVVTILLVNSDDNIASTFGSVFIDSGISKYGFTPSSTTAMPTWPTLKNLITADTRLVTFIASIDYDSSYPYLLPEFNYVFETTFGVVDMGGFNCTLQRPSTVSSAVSGVDSGYMGLLNHFKDTAESFGITVPDQTNLTTTNSPSTTITGAAGKHGSDCQNEWGVKPVFILVDYFNVGPAITTADQLNGITAVGRTNVSTSELSATTSGASGSRERSFFSIAVIAMAVVAVGNFVLL